MYILLDHKRKKAWQSDIMTLTLALALALGMALRKILKYDNS